MSKTTTVQRKRPGPAKLIPLVDRGPVGPGEDYLRFFTKRNNADPSLRED